jgi:hypothetical protein
VTTKATLAATILFSLGTWPSFGQSVHDDGLLQSVLSGLRACVRSHAAEVYSLGIRATKDAEELLLNRCSKTVRDELAKSPEITVPPGRFRITAREEWAAYLGGLNGK